MPITVKHTKVSTIPDDADTSLVRPSDWNADHTLVGLGTMAEQNANNVNITGGSITGVTGVGDVVGPASSTDNAVARFDTTTGKLLQNSVVTVGDTGEVLGITTLAASTSVTSPILKAASSAGGALQNTGGTNQLQWGSGGGNNLSLDVATNINPANAQVDISPTGTGTVRINPATAGTINNTSIGATTPSTGSFTKELINQSYDQGTGVLQVAGTSTFNGTVVDKTLSLQGGNNLGIQSQTIGGTGWFLTFASATTNYTTAPDGTTTASNVSETAATNAHYTNQNTVTVVSGNVYTASVYIKKGDGATAPNWIQFGFNIAGFGGTYANFNISTNAIGTSTVTSSTITSVGNGWYRCTITATATSSSSTSATFIGFNNNNGSAVVVPSYAGSTTANFFAWGAQFELGTVASAYTPTTTAAITTTNNISVPSGQVLAQNGTAALPSYSFSAVPASGLYNLGNGVIGYTQAGTVNIALGYDGNGSLRLLGAGGISFCNTNIAVPDLFVFRDAANTLAQRNSTNAQTFRLYNTYTDASNYERLSIDWSTQANNMSIFTQAAGTGSLRTMSIRASALYLGGNNATQVYLNGNGLMPQVDATYDLGIASSGRYRNAFFSGVVTTNSDASINTVTVGLGGGAVSTNTAVGNFALAVTATGGNNVAVGAGALRNNTSGAVNTATGVSALNLNLTGSNLTATGFGALNFNVTGSNSVAFGFASLYNNTTASNLTAIGTQALNNNTTNVATLGTVTGGTGYTNGTYTGVVMTLSSGSTAITYPTATIVVAGGVVTTVTITSAGVGFKDTTTVLTAPAASIGGTGSGFSVPVASLASGFSNTAVGYQALFNNNIGAQNTALGLSALLANTTGNNNTAIGTSALASNTTAPNNTAIGFSSLSANTSGQNNTAQGRQSLGSNTTGSNNIALGFQAAFNGANSNTTGSNNTYVGYQTVGSGVANTNEMVIGYQAVGLGSNTTVIGNSSTTLTKAFGVIIGTNYTVATLPSASTSGVGARAFVTDALTPSFGVAVTGGGAVPIPVYSTGSAWNVG